MGHPVPKTFEEAPELWPGLELYLVGFFDLSGERSIGMTAGPIPWSAIQRYCDHHHLDPDQGEEMHHHIAVLDDVWRKHHEAKNGQP